jgi:hypothetical protein
MPKRVKVPCQMVSIWLERLNKTMKSLVRIADLWSDI